MEALMKWMTDVFAPRMNKIGHNPWLAAIQEAILTAIPVILLGSFITLINLLKNIFPGFPDLSRISTFSLGFVSLYLSYLVPSSLMEKKKHGKTKREAGIAGIAFFLILVGPTFDKSSNIVIPVSALGTGGMFAVLVSGLFVGFVMNLFASHSFFKEDTPIPDFITIWFDTLIPMLLILAVGWLLVFQLKFDIFGMLQAIFQPFLYVANTFWGFVLYAFLTEAFLYSFGISGWVFTPIGYAITYGGLAANQAAVAAGKVPTVINAYGIGNWYIIGGSGCTLALCIMLCFLAKSQRCKAVGRAAMVPSIFNINEPLVFGAPIAFNPIMMVPMWISGFVAPSLIYAAFYFNFIPKITSICAFWYFPSPVITSIIGGLPGLVMCLIIFALTWLIYWPFFKVYDAQCLKEEQQPAEAKEAEA